MSSQPDDHHLDATAGREVVFCHACSHEWYRDEHGLECPQCGGDITEIVEPGNDPRDLENGSSESTSPEPNHHHFGDDDSDPDEADITEHFGPQGFTFRRSVRDGPDHTHHNPAVDPVLERFLDMIQGFTPPRRTEEGGLFPQEQEQEHSPFGGMQPPRIHRTTFTSGPFGGGTTSVTIVSGPLQGARPGGSPGGAGLDPFQAYASSPRRPQQPAGLRVTAISMTLGANRPPRIFSSIVRDIGPPHDANHNQAGAEGAGGAPPQGFARSLHDILSLFNPANAMAGDAVYSQEALDRIITSLMEANPQSNAAPPATEEGLRNLSRKPVDREMLGPDGKTECTICIDEMKEGETVIYLPCKHWFHEDCVVLWLKEHNTCPICRTPIEKNEGGARSTTSNNNNNNSGDANPGEGSSGSHSFPTPPRPGFSTTPSWFSGHSSGFGGFADDHDATQNNPFQFPRPQTSVQNHLQALRALQDGTRPNLQRERERDRNRDRGMTSGFSTDSSRMQRRSSHSPTSPRTSGPEEHGARMRQRSPSQSRWSIDRERESRRSSGHGPFSWFRDRFGGGGGSGNGSSRDERRQ